MKKIRVLHIGKYYHPYIGGTETHLFTLVNELKKDAQVEVLASNIKPGNSIEDIDGVRVCRLSTWGRLFSLPLTFSLPFWLKRKEADILHFHLPNPLSVIAYFLARPKGRVVVSYHSDILRQRILNPLFNPLLIRFLKKARGIIVTSDNLITNSPILARFKEKCRVVPHGIDLKVFNPDKNTLEKANRLRNKYGGPLILFAGRLVYYKGLEYLLKAMQDVEAKLLIVGKGPLENKLKRLAERYGVADKVIWAGEIPNAEIAAYYYACDIFVLPSHLKTESFGIVQLEAFACAKPVVSTDLPTGVPFVNQDQKTGLVVPPADTQALAVAINKLLSSPALRHTYGQNAKKRVENEFTKEQMAWQVGKIYQAIVQDPVLNRAQSRPGLGS